jgi:hypothetical protein
VNDDLPISEEQADAEDNDPWTFFGSYSDADIITASNLLQRTFIPFHVTHNNPSETAATMTSATFEPHHLWVREDHVQRAQSILVPYFQNNDPHA